MKDRLRRLLREPLLHFFLLGLVVFGLHAALNSEANTDSGNDPRLVEITSADIDWLRSTWNKKMGREPTQPEMKNLLAGFLREEILYREAVSMGLDQHDAVVRRRMAQKMDFLFKDIAEMAEPSGEEIAAWFAENIERYRQPSLVSFTHIYFNEDKRGGRVRDDALESLEKIRNEGTDPAEAPALGDQFLFQHYFPRQGVNITAREFGRAFAGSLESFEAGRWHGPVASGYGLHLVYVHDRTETRLPELEEVRENVLRDLMSERREEVNAAAYGEISSKYRILVEDMPYGKEEKGEGRP